MTEHLSYLMTDVSTTLKALINNEPDPISVDMATGQRNWNSAIKKFRQDPDAYVQSRVLEKILTNIWLLSNQDAADSPAFDDNIAALKEIKELCDENGVTLKVVIGASFIGERESYECYRYYDYLRQIVAITDVWDFSDYNDINMNPYNFYNRKHYTNAVGDLMINTIYGKETHEGSGIYLTEDNIEDYLARRPCRLPAAQRRIYTPAQYSCPAWMIPVISVELQEKASEFILIQECCCILAAHI